MKKKRKQHEENIDPEHGEYLFNFDSDQSNKERKVDIIKLLDEYRINYSYTSQGVRPDGLTNTISKKFIDFGNPLINFLLISLNLEKNEYNIYDLTFKIYSIPKRDLDQIISNIESFKNYTVQNALPLILIGNRPSDINNLQPTTTDLYILDFFHKYCDYLTFYNTERRWNKCSVVLRDILKVDDLRRNINMSINSHDKITHDLDIRAEIVSSKIRHILMANQTVKLILMDGHGRIIYRCLEKLIDLMDRISLCVYDIDLVTDTWHKLTLPYYNVDNSPTTYNENIFPKINDEILQNNIIYLNFSGIGGNENVRELIDIIDTVNVNNLKNLIISFSNIRAAEAANDELIQSLLQKNFVKLGDRIDFVTYYLP
jgi:hypothetical protein